MRGSRWMGLAGMLALLMLLVSSGLAQTTLSYGSGVVDKVDDETPFVFFNFGGGEGDLVTVRVVSLGAGFSPSVSINSPSGEQIAFGTTDLTSPGIGNVRADVILPQGGNYNIQVGSLDGSQGQFLIRIDGLPTQNAPVLEAPAATLTPVNFLPGQSVQLVGFSASPASELELVAQAEGLPFSVAVHMEDGTLAGIIGSEDGSPTSLDIPAGEMNYFAVLGNRNRDETPVEIGLLAGDAASTPPTTDSGDSTTTTTGECTIITGGNGTNLRTGPGTNYDIITGLPANTSYPVTGQNSNWYTINYNGAQGWMAGSVTTLSGACDTVPVVPAPAPPEQPAQPADPVTTPESTAPTEEGAPTPTEEAAPPPTQPGAPTEPAAPPPTEPAAPPPTEPPPPTEEAAPVAPPDSSIFVDVSIKGGQATVGDVVSYPGGDTEDEVFMSAVDFDSVTTSGNIQMVFTCTGDGQGNVSFRIGTSTYSCGDVNDEFVTNDSDNRTIRVTATGGDNILVNWSILFIGSN